MKSKMSSWLSIVLAVAILSSVVPAAVFAEEPVHIVFVATRAHLQRGECAMLEWHVEGGFEVLLNGKVVKHVGHKKVCPKKTTVYFLKVDTGERMEGREVAIVVEGAGEPSPGGPQHPSPQEPPHPPPGVTIDFRADRTHINAGQCTILRWDVEHAKEVYLNGKGVVGHSSKKVCPQVTKTYVLHVIHKGGTTDKKITIHVAGGGGPSPTQPGGPGKPGKRSADLAVTDLYADKLPHGKVYVRVTNRGPAILANTKIELKCNSYGKPLGNTPPWSHVEAPWRRTVNLKPGQTATFPTKMTVDTSKYSYDVTCAVSPPSQGATFSDPNWSNNNYSEAIASNSTKKPPVPSPSAINADLAVTDLYPTRLRNGKLYARITNRGPATLTNAQATLLCQGGAWQGGQPTSLSNSRSVNLNLSHGQTQAFDTGITINVDQYNYYEMTCTVQAAFDSNPANDSYSELIP